MKEHAVKGLVVFAHQVNPEGKLLNVEVMHAKHPETFHIPPRTVREDVAKGNYVKVCLNKPDVTNGERFWVEVVDYTDAGKYVGFLSNQLVLWRDFEYITFGPEHILEILER